MRLRIHALLFIFVLTSCETEVDHHGINVQEQQDDDVEQQTISYTKFNPDRIENFEVEGFDIEEAFRLDSIIIFSAYSNGDIESAKTPVDWGDGLTMLKNDSIYFQSKRVGDPYQYEPNFYRNESNGKVIIICQLGNEENYGGEAFLLNNGNVKFIGKIEMECPFETFDNTGLIEIIRISENGNSIYFDFESDTLINLTKNEWERIVNDSIYYKYTDENFKLIGL